MEHLNFVLNWKENIVLVTALVAILSILFFTGTSAASDAEVLTPEKTQTIAPAGSQPSAKGPADFFTGDVRIDPLFPATDEINASAAYVTFEPGARSHWHTHPCGQQLIVVSGVGLTGVWDGPVTEIRAGDVVTCPVGVKHWHGASPTAAMTHIAVTGSIDGRAVEWMEPVTDEQYNHK